MESASGNPQLAGFGEEEALLAAVRAVFVNKNGSEMLSTSDQLIEEKKEQMVQVCKRNRLQVETGINDLLQGREGLVDSAASLKATSKQASELLSTIDDARTLSKDLVLIRVNLEATLAVVQRTRRLVKLRARATSSMYSGRLHAAMQLISLLQRESALSLTKYVELLKLRKPNLVQRYLASSDRLFMSEVLPDPSSLVLEVRQKQNAIYRGFQSYLSITMEEVGRYALSMDEFNGWLPDIPDDMSEVDGDHDGGAPRLIVRPLLGCLLVHGDMDRLAEFRAQYAKQRKRHFESNLYIYPSADLKRVNITLACLTGFFIVEKTISKYVFASPTISKYVGPDGLLSAAEINDWWVDGQRRLIESLDKLEYNDADMRSQVTAAVEKFVQCLRSYGVNRQTIEAWI